MCWFSVLLFSTFLISNLFVYFFHSFTMKVFWFDALLSLWNNPVIHLLNFRSWCQSILPSSNRLLFYLISVKAIAVLVHSLIECWSPVNQWDCYLCIIWICLCTPGDTLCKNFVPEVHCVVFWAIFAKIKVEERYIWVVVCYVEYVCDLKDTNVDLHTPYLAPSWDVVCFVGCRTC